MNEETELSNSRRNGVLYQRNPVDNSKWLPQLFFLIRDRLCFSEERIFDNDEEEEDTTKHLLLEEEIHNNNQFINKTIKEI